jgi:hypothetical protein
MTELHLNPAERRYILQRLNMAIVAACADPIPLPLLQKAATEVREAADCLDQLLTIATRLAAATADPPPSPGASAPAEQEHQH